MYAINFNKSLAETCPLGFTAKRTVYMLDCLPGTGSGHHWNAARLQ